MKHGRQITVWAALAVIFCALTAVAQQPPVPGDPFPEKAAFQLPDRPSGPPHPVPPSRKPYAVPAGTKVLLQLKSAINTRSAKPGDGVYLTSAFPVVIANRVVIPVGSYVQGVIDHVVRPGRIKGKAQLEMHFTSIIFPNGTVVEIPGQVSSLPGAKDQSVRDDGEGTIQQSGGKGANAGKVAAIAIPTGGLIGAIGSMNSGHPLAGGLAGAAAGAAAVGIVSLFSRGSDVMLATGTQVEMIFERPLYLEEESLGSSGSQGGQGGSPPMVPSENHSRPMEKPERRPLFCPPGSLGCE